jgi:hypothetical protein
VKLHGAFPLKNTAAHVTGWSCKSSHELPQTGAPETAKNEVRFAIAAQLQCKRADFCLKPTCIDILRYLVYIHASIHIIHILIHRNSRLIAGFLPVFHTTHAEYGSFPVEKNYKNESRGTHALCKYGITVTGKICSFRMQNYAVTSKFNVYFTKTAMFFCNFPPPEIKRNGRENSDAVVAMLRERRLIQRLL